MVRPPTSDSQLSKQSNLAVKKLSLTYHRMIGSAAVTIPAAAWLLQQGPKKGDHGHGGHEEHHEEKSDEGKEEEEQPQEEESKGEESKEESKDDDQGKDESKDEGKDEGKDEEKDQGKEDSEGGDEKAEKSKSDDSGKDKGGDKSDDDGYEAPGPNAPKQINWTSSSSKGPGEGQKGTRAPTEKKGEKDVSISDKCCSNYS